MTGGEVTAVAIPAAIKLLTIAEEALANSRASEAEALARLDAVLAEARVEVAGALSRVKALEAATDAAVDAAGPTR